MQIYVKNDGNSRSLSIIELQGDLLSRNGELKPESKLVGDLHFTTDGKKTPILIIGHHILHGKTQELEKPMVLLEKGSNNENVEYKMHAVIRRKYIFKMRPKPIVSTVLKKAL